MKITLHIVLMIVLMFIIIPVIIIVDDKYNRELKETRIIYYDAGMNEGIADIMRSCATTGISSFGECSYHIKTIGNNTCEIKVYDYDVCYDIWKNSIMLEVFGE